MARKASKGACRLCNLVLSGTGMSKHLQSCIPKHIEGLQKTKGLKAGSFFHLMVQGALRLTPLSRPQNWKNKVDVRCLEYGFSVSIVDLRRGKIPEALMGSLTVVKGEVPF